MREVTREEFFKGIGDQNVHPYPEGPPPYTSYFKTPSGEVRGKIVSFFPRKFGFPQQSYWLPDEQTKD